MKKEAAVVRYGATQEVGVFAGDCGGLKSRDFCVIKTSRGTELGRVLLVSQAEEDEISGDLLRKATPEDIISAKRISDTEEPQEFQF